VKDTKLAVFFIYRERKRFPVEFTEFAPAVFRSVLIRVAPGHPFEIRVPSCEKKGFPQITLIYAEFIPTIF
jgi:hypothetical protein